MFTVIIRLACQELGHISRVLKVDIDDLYESAQSDRLEQISIVQRLSE